MGQVTGMPHTRPLHIRQRIEFRFALHARLVSQFWTVFAFRGGAGCGDEEGGTCVLERSGMNSAYIAGYGLHAVQGRGVDSVKEGRFVDGESSSAQL
jgi:hypothetical protein